MKIIFAINLTLLSVMVMQVLFFSPSYSEPVIFDENFKIELVAQDLDEPTSMAFIDEDDILVLEKNNGKVQRIIDGIKQGRPILDVNVANKWERGLLGIATYPKILTDKTLNDQQKFVFLFYTESAHDGNDICEFPTLCDENTNPYGNRLYRYELHNDKLTNPQLLLDLPAGPGADHVSGIIAIGPDNNIYIMSGDGDSLWRGEKLIVKSRLSKDFDPDLKDSVAITSNDEEGKQADGRGGILRLTMDGWSVPGGILGTEFPLNLYYAYGLRNGFGMDFDPITGNLWITENGPGFGDEINLVEPGFNSGWRKVQGIWPVDEQNSNPLPLKRGYFGNEEFFDFDNLVNLSNYGKYSEPEFIWNSSVGVTALKFFDSKKMGNEYFNDLFVTDFNNNYIYHFDLNYERTQLELRDSLTDKIANTNEELNSVVFGKDFGVITDMDIGYDGYLYLLSYTEGKIYRIVPV
ncbi:MAG TPA: PQQ-dependent sugar dehydrogenase [Nitrososphaeraceae archaeon]|nr:PQQ-dependent sugar dehydrogenase [Nitrososphaeraceae archaeon]